MNYYNINNILKLQWVSHAICRWEIHCIDRIIEYCIASRNVISVQWCESDYLLLEKSAHIIHLLTKHYPSESIVFFIPQAILPGCPPIRITFYIYARIWVYVNVEPINSLVWLNGWSLLTMERHKTHSHHSLIGDLNEKLLFVSIAIEICVAITQSVHHHNV